MAVTNNYTVRSMQEIGDLLKIANSKPEEKESTMSSNEQQFAPEQNAANLGAELHQALGLMRNALAQNDELRAKTEATAENVTRMAEEARKEAISSARQVEEQLGEMKKTLADVAASAASQAGGSLKRPLYVRAYKMASELGGVAALTAGVVYGSMKAYERYSEANA